MVCRSVSEKGIRKILMRFGEELFLEDFTIKPVQDYDSVIIMVTVMWQDCFLSVFSSLSPQSLSSPETKVEIMSLGQILNMFGSRADGTC